MKVQYTGQHDEVFVPELYDERTGLAYAVKRGDSVEVPDEVGERMIIQRANWRPSAGGKLREYADIAAEVRELEAKEAAGPDEPAPSEPPTDDGSETGGNTPEG